MRSIDANPSPPCPWPDYPEPNNWTDTHQIYEALKPQIDARLKTLGGSPIGYQYIRTSNSRNPNTLRLITSTGTGEIELHWGGLTLGDWVKSSLVHSFKSEQEQYAERGHNKQ